MTDLLDALLKMVDEHLSLYRELSDLLVREQAALIDLDVESVQETSKAKENTALKIRLHVSGLAESIRKTGVGLGLAEDPMPTLAELAAVAPRPYSIELDRASLALARLKRGVMRHSEANQAFVQEALDQISGSLAILTGASGARRKGYLSSGQKAPAGDQGPSRLSREV